MHDSLVSAAAQCCSVSVCVQKDQEVHRQTKRLLLPVRPVSPRAQPPQVSTSAVACVEFEDNC